MEKGDIGEESDNSVVNMSSHTVCAGQKKEAMTVQVTMSSATSSHRMSRKKGCKMVVAVVVVAVPKVS